jgi:peptide/nickel transport system permease protein
MGGLSGFVMVRTLRTLLTLLGVVTLTFMLGRISGDPVAMMLPQTATEADRLALQAALGLDKPIPEQFAIYVANLFQGDFGRSITFNRSALDVVLERVPATLALGLPSFLLSLLLGIPLGVLCARLRDSALDRTVMSWSLIFQSLPSFVLGIGLIVIFGVVLRALPTFGSDTWQHYILPLVTLTVYPLAILIRLTRSAMLDVLNDDYIRTAHAKGARGWRVLTHHALRNALIPIITVTGLQVAGILSGAAIIETVFAWPGIGRLAVNAIGVRDFPVVQTVVLFSAIAFAISNLFVDILYAVVDPRIKVA